MQLSIQCPLSLLFAAIFIVASSNSGKDLYFTILSLSYIKENRKRNLNLLQCSNGFNLVPLFTKPDGISLLGIFAFDFISDCYCFYSRYLFWLIPLQPFNIIKMILDIKL